MAAVRATIRTTLPLLVAIALLCAMPAGRAEAAGGGRISTLIVKLKKKVTEEFRRSVKRMNDRMAVRTKGPQTYKPRIQIQRGERMLSRLIALRTIGRSAGSSRSAIALRSLEERSRRVAARVELRRSQIRFRWTEPALHYVRDPRPNLRFRFRGAAAL